MKEIKNNNNERNFKQMFNLNNILSQIINYAAYLIMIGSALALIYVSFISKFNIKIDWTTLGIFSGAAVVLSWLNWNTWYRKQYEDTLAKDIAQHMKGKYSIHARFYYAVKDFTEAELQTKIDEFDDRYTKNWLNYVERITGKPIETKQEIVLDKDGNPELTENGDIKIIVTKGIKDLKYWGFKHPILMWRIKNHKYPHSGYKTAMEVMTLLSFQESNLNKRHLKAYRTFHIKKSLSKLLSSLLFVSIGGAIAPEFISGNIGSAVLKLIIALGSLGTAVLTGAINGTRGARLRLSTVEDVCVDLEEWGNKKPIIVPYVITTQFDNSGKLEVTKDEEVKTDTPAYEVAAEIFNLQK